MIAMRYTLTLAAFGLFTNLIGCAPSADECLEFTAPIVADIDKIDGELEAVRANVIRLADQVTRLQEQYETPETLSIDEVTREYPCLYVAAWNTWSYYDEEQNRSPGIAYDFAIVPVLEEHPTMIKSFMFDSKDKNIVTVVWFPKSALATDYKQTAWYVSGIESGETATALDNVDPFTCRKYK